MEYSIWGESRAKSHLYWIVFIFLNTHSHITITARDSFPVFYFLLDSRVLFVRTGDLLRAYNSHWGNTLGIRANNSCGIGKLFYQSTHRPHVTNSVLIYSLLRHVPCGPCFILFPKSFTAEQRAIGCRSCGTLC